jgi:pyrroloquinoline quinone biosynthesis protein B
MNNHSILTLGTVQDGGFPHIGCNLECCNRVRLNPIHSRLVSSISILDNVNSHAWIIDVSPDIARQISILMEYIPNLNYPCLSGLFLTHAHIGHYMGLLYFGLEALNLKNLPVYVLPRMKDFLYKNSMFYQMIENKNIIIKELKDNSRIKLNNTLELQPFFVPHRNELSETVGYKIIGENSSVIYLPDIDSWSDWDISLIDIIKDNDVVIIDGTFFSKDEIVGRNINKIPHPTIMQSMDLTKGISLKDKNKVFFTHLNHTNKVLNSESQEYKKVITSGYNILEDRKIFNL